MIILIGHKSKPDSIGSKSKFSYPLIRVAYKVEGPINHEPNNHLYTLTFIQKLYKFYCDRERNMTYGIGFP